MEKNLFRLKCQRLDMIEQSIKYLEAEYRAIANELMAGSLSKQPEPRKIEPKKEEKANMNEIKQPEPSKKKKPVNKKETFEDFLKRLHASGKSYQEMQIEETLWMQKHGVL